MLINKETNSIYLTKYLDREVIDEIDEVCDFIKDPVNFEYELTPNLKLFIDCEGGNTYFALRIINSILTLRGTITGNIYAIVEGVAWSSAAFIAMACDNLILREGSSIMFHSTSLKFEREFQENILNFERFLESNKKHSDHLNSLCSPFLTDEEIERTQRGEEIYINWDDEDLSVRINRHFVL